MKIHSLTKISSAIGIQSAVQHLGPAFKSGVITSLAALVVFAGSAEAQWRKVSQNQVARPQAAQAPFVSDAHAAAVAAGDPGCPTQRPVKNIVGSWLMTADTGFTFKALATFFADGNVIFVTQGEAAAQPLFTSEHGVWGCIGKRFTFNWLEINYNSDGSFAGIFKIRANADVSPSGNEIEQRFVYEFTDADGKLVDSGSGTATGKRIHLEPLP